MVNIAEPVPPSALTTIIHHRLGDMATPKVVIATISIPRTIALRSPVDLPIRGTNGLLTSRIKANMETTSPSWKLSAPKVRAKGLSTGITTPKPTAIRKVVVASTHAVRGNPVALSRAPIPTSSPSSGPRPTCQPTRVPWGGLVSRNW